MRDPFPTYRRMREEAAAHWSDANGGTWFIPRYKDVRDGFLDMRLSSSRKSGAAANQFPEHVRAEFESCQGVMREWLVLQDPPRHTPLRKLMSRGFVRPILEGLRPRIQEVTDQLLDRAASESTINFVEALARPLPGQIVCDLLGVESSVQDDFMRWSEDIVSFGGSLAPSVELFRRAMTSILEMIAYFKEVVPQRRLEKGDDMISLLLRAEEAGDVVTTDQVLANCVQLVFAGHETTRNLLANGLYLLLTHPQALEDLRRDPALMPTAVLEFLRIESPLQLIRRVVDVDMKWCGVDMKAGHGLVLMTGSANRDPEAFDDPDRLDIRRAPVRQLAFGHGIHRCIGAELAAIETEIGLNTVLRRFPGIGLAKAEPQRVMNPMLRGLSELAIHI
ncbi:MAG: cytochrome P450 [Polyangiaceae bacterium]